MIYKLILLYICVILNTNGLQAGKFGGGGRGSSHFRISSGPVKSFKSTPIRSSVFSTTPQKSVSVTPFKSFSTPSRQFSPVQQGSGISNQNFRNTPFSTNSNGVGKLQPVTSSNPNFGFLKGLPRNNLDNGKVNTNVHAIGFRHNQNNAATGKLTPVTSSNPEFGFLKGMPRNNVEKKSENSPLSEVSKRHSPAPATVNLTPVTSINPQYGFLKGMPRNNVNNNFVNLPASKAITQHSTSMTSNNPNFGIPHNNFEPNFENPALRKTYTEVGHSNVPDFNTLGHQTPAQVSVNNHYTHVTNNHNVGFKLTHHPNLALSALTHLAHSGHSEHSGHQNSHKFPTSSMLGHNESEHCQNLTQNDSNDLKQINKTIETLLKELAAVKQNFTEVKSHLNISNSKAKEDIAWMYIELDKVEYQLHHINTSNSKVNLQLCVEGKLVHNLSNFTKLLNDTHYIGHRNHPKAINFGSFVKPAIKTAYQTAVTRHSNILKSHNTISDHYPEHTGGSNCIEAQVVTLVSYILILLIVNY